MYSERASEVYRTFFFFSDNCFTVDFDVGTLFGSVLLGGCYIYIYIYALLYRREPLSYNSSEWFNGHY